MHRIKTNTETKLGAHYLATEELEDHQQKQSTTNSKPTKAFSCRVVSLEY